MKQGSTIDLVKATLEIPLPDDDEDFTPEIARKVIEFYREALTFALDELLRAKSKKH